MIRHISFSLKFWKDGLSQLFAQLDSHLVEGVDIPNDSLGENLVLIEGDECAKDVRGQLRVEEGIGGSVARKGFGGHEPFQLFPGITFRYQFSMRLFWRSSFHESLGLS